MGILFLETSLPLPGALVFGAKLISLICAVNRYKLKINNLKSLSLPFCKMEFVKQREIKAKEKLIDQCRHGRGEVCQI